MSRSIVELYEDQVEYDPGSAPFGLLPTRRQMVESLKSGHSVDVVVLGNDLPCAVAAQLLALNGVRALLLTPGSLTPMGAASVIDVVECSRAPLIKVLRHLPSLIKRGNSLARYAPHRMVTIEGDKGGQARSLTAKILSRIGVPAVIDDSATVAEALLAARRDGAIVLPYLEPLYLEMVGDSGIRIMGIRDQLSGETFEVRSGGVVVGHGVSVPGSRLRVGSEGVTPVLGEAIAQVEVVPRVHNDSSSSSEPVGPTLEKFRLKDGREIFSLKRSTDTKLLTVALSDAGREFKEVMDAVGRSIGEIVGSIIVPRKSFVSGSELIFGKGVMRIPSSSPLIAFSIANTLAYTYARSAGRILNDVVTADTLTNPGALRTLRSGARSPIESFKKEATQSLVSQEAIHRAIARWGDRVRYIGDFNEGFCPVGNHVLRGELGIAVLADQVFHVDDLPHSLLRYRVEDPQEREKFQSEIVALQQESSLHSEIGGRNTI
jgi:hypothetical protein